MILLPALLIVFFTCGSLWPASWVVLAMPQQCADGSIRPCPKPCPDGSTPACPKRCRDGSTPPCPKKGDKGQTGSTREPRQPGPVEVAYWNSINEMDIDGLLTYLRRYPHGFFRDLANVRLARRGRIVKFDSITPGFDAKGQLVIAERKRLDNLAKYFKQASGISSRIFIIAYGGRHSRPEEAQAYGSAAMGYLMNSHGLYEGQLKGVVGGYREKPTLEVWFTDDFGEEPRATPTVKLDEVRPAQLIKR